MASRSDNKAVVAGFLRAAAADPAVPVVWEDVVFLLALPYVATLVALLFRSGRSASPAALGQPYVRG